MSAGAPGGGAGAGAVVRQGHLRKLKTMKKKYFVLRAESKDCSARLEYYESEKKFRSGAAPRRVLPLKTCYNITRRLDLKQKHVIALFTREEQFCVVAENEKDLHDWLAAILKQHGCDDASEELLHPIQHVWQVNVQKKGLGASKNIQGLYNLCLTDKTLTLVKIKSQNNVISDLGIPERIEYSLKNIRRCGDSECFFYMEVGRQTSTGAGELWMHSDDSNIAQSMHSTILLAMKNCAKMTENERDHIIIPKGSFEAPNRRATYSADGTTKLSNEKGLCVGSCIRQCVCSTVPYSIEDSAAAAAPVTPNNAENQPPNNSLIIDKPENTTRVIKHHRTVSLPTGCSLFQEPLKIVHERTRSAPLTGDEVDRVTIEKSVTHSSCKAVNGTDTFPAKKTQWSRRASTGTRLSKLSPAHTKNASIPRHRCESMPSRASSSFETERPTPRHNDHVDGVEGSRDETDAMAEWYRTPRIPEEPDCDMPKDFMSPGGRTSVLCALAVQHSRTSSLGMEEEPRVAGYLPMGPHDASGLISASSGSVCSGTPSTDPRFSEYQLEPATSHIAEGERPPRAYSVGSRPARTEPPRHRAYSVGHAGRPTRRPAPASAPLLPRASAEDLMELDFSGNSQPASPAARTLFANDPVNKVVIARTPPSTIGFHERHKPAVDEYVDMSPRNAGYVEMRPGSPPDRPALASLPPSLAPLAPPLAPLVSTLTPSAATPDGYVEMNYTRAPSRTSTGPIAIAPRVPPPSAVVNALPPSLVSVAPLSAPPADEAPLRRPVAVHGPCPTPHGSQTLFPLSLDSPASPPELDDAADISDDDAHELSSHPLSTVREISEEGRRSPVVTEAAHSPAYVRLARPPSRPIAAPPAPSAAPLDLPGNPTATKTLARHNHAAAEPAATVVVAGCATTTAARFVVESPPPTASPLPSPAPTSGGSSPLSPAPPAVLNYAALDLEPRRPPQAPALRTYTQIDFVRSEKLHADAT